MSGDAWTDDPFASPGPWDVPVTNADFARQRRPGRSYLSRSFPIKPPSQDAGHPGRFVYKVFDDEPGERAATIEWSEEIVVDGQRRQIRLLIAREAGVLKELCLWRIPSSGEHEELLKLNRAQAGRLVNLLKALDHILNPDGVSGGSIL